MADYDRLKLWEIWWWEPTDSEDPKLPVLFNGVTSCGLHQDVLSQFGKMFVQVGDMIERTGQNFLHLVQRNLVEDSEFGADIRYDIMEGL